MPSAADYAAHDRAAASLIIDALAKSERGRALLAPLAALQAQVPAIDREHRNAFRKLLAYIVANDIPAALAELLKPHAKEDRPAPLELAARRVVDSWERGDLADAVRELSAAINSRPFFHVARIIPQNGIMGPHLDAVVLRSGCVLVLGPDGGNVYAPGTDPEDALGGAEHLATPPASFSWPDRNDQPAGIDSSKALAACRSLVDAYRAGLDSGGSVDWSDVDDAHALAREAIGLPPTDADEVEDEDAEDEDDANPIRILRPVSPKS